MALVFFTLLGVSITASISDIDPNSRSLLQILQFTTSSPTTPSPTLVSGDLSICDDTVTLSAGTEETDFWFSINSVAEDATIGIDVCDYGEGNNDFYFYMRLENFAGNYRSSASYTNNPARCTFNGDGAYLEWTRLSYYTDSDYWLRVTVYSANSGDIRMLRLTRRCDILPTTPLPTPSPTTPAPITSSGEIHCDDRVEGALNFGPHYYEFYLSFAARVRFQDCETDFDPNLYVYDMNTLEEVQDSVCDGDDCGNCTNSLREQFTLTLNPGSYYVMIRECCSNNQDTGGATYVIETSCTANQIPTTSDPTTSDPTNYPTTYEPSRSPLLPGQTHPPTTAKPTRNPVTKRPSRSPTTAVPTTVPTTAVPTEKKTVFSGAECYSVTFSIVVMFVGTLFV